MFLSLFNALIKKKQRVIRIFNILWLILIICFFFAAGSVFSPDNKAYVFWYDFALLCGKTGIIFFVITLLPGIFNRFRIRNRILGIIMIFRRQFGITMFLLAAFHGLIVGVLPKISTGNPLNYVKFELYGLFAVILLFFLFITSNDFSQMKMGKLWYALHRLVYIIMWLILIHVALQRFSLWSVTAGVLVLAEMSGIIYSHISRKNSDKS